jgi:REP element-mobilizing transposase RayT
VHASADNLKAERAKTTHIPEAAMAGTFTNLVHHLVFSTKNRIPLISARLEKDLYAYIAGIIRGEGGQLLEIGGMPDHIHILARMGPTRSVSETLKRIKANSSKWINQDTARVRKFGWQDGYAAFSVSQSQVVSVRRYIREQKQHHGRKSFQDEFRALLEKHGIEYDDRYLWD